MWDLFSERLCGVALQYLASRCLVFRPSMCPGRHYVTELLKYSGINVLLCAFQFVQTKWGSWSTHRWSAPL